SPRPTSPLFPYTTLFRSGRVALTADGRGQLVGRALQALDALLARLRCVFLHRRHRAPPEIRDELVKEARLALVEALRVIRLVQRSEEHTSELQSPYDLVC